MRAWPGYHNEGTPQEEALEALRDLVAIVDHAAAYAEAAGRQIVNGSMQDHLELPDTDASPGRATGPYEYAEGTLEYAQFVRGAGALDVARRVLIEALATLETPLLQRSRVGD